MANNKVGMFVEDGLLAAPRVAGAGFNTVGNLYTTGKNILKRTRAVGAKTTALIVDAFTHNPFQYEGMKTVSRKTMGFVDRWKTRFGNMRTGIKNTGRFSGNTFKKTVLASVMSLGFLTAGAVEGTVGTGLRAVKETASSLALGVHDAADAVLIMGDTDHETDYGYSKIEAPVTAGYQETKDRIAALREQRRAERKARKIKKAEERAARLKAEGAEVNGSKSTEETTKEKKAEAKTTQKKDAETPTTVTVTVPPKDTGKGDEGTSGDSQKSDEKKSEEKESGEKESGEKEKKENSTTTPDKSDGSKKK